MLHDIDNLSNHGPIVLQLSLDMKYIGFQDRIDAPRVSWVKANDADYKHYKNVLSSNWQRIVIPVDAFCAVM